MPTSTGTRATPARICSPERPGSGCRGRWSPAASDAQQDNAKQVADVENFLRQGIDLLIISPNEAKPLTPVVQRAFEAGIPVIVLDREIEGDTYTSFLTK